MKLYLHFFMLHLKCVWQYRISFLFLMIGQFLTSFNLFLGITLLFERFHKVKDYRYSEIILCFAIVLMAFTLAEMFVRGFDMFSNTISNGEFDRILLRPRNEVFLVLAGKMEFTRVGRLIQTVVMLVYAINVSDIVWTASKILTLILMILCGSIIFGCVFVIYASLCFFTLEGLEFINILTDGGREFGKYPIDVYGRKVLKFCTYVIPYALVQYYPFLYLTGRTDNRLYMLLPLAACLFIIPCRSFWKFGVRHYKSTGS